ncbi:Fe2+-dependent dioxygenase [Hydrogenophaga sp. PAMC20947]|uniref:Fe2+-dependent dioxygenase n=1 Tax=Hydrogenophaga sp. PAMC20947 TaxID=2565558 RepID=UPI00109E0521|nr:Fe2+-dependent dioxygenase [Hydrogenophaga sp. PAMC20947]QCB45831.1 Fe2+-dependent dioxygenase [Hydrogenophaga sp. PAMC20947]
MLLNLPDILSLSEVQQAQQLMQSAPWGNGTESAGRQARAVKNNQQLPHDCEAALAIRTLVLNGLNRSPIFFSAALPLRIFTPRVNRYGDDTNAYGPHVDNAIRLKAGEAGQTDYVRTDISCTVFLNEPDDYDGGELNVSDTYGTQAIKLPAGHAVLYPGTSLHEVTPVSRGHRLACFFWVQSMVRSDEQRRLLYDLDMNLLALRSQHGETPETTAITGTYHNLLRMWAST